MKASHDVPTATFIYMNPPRTRSPLPPGPCVVHFRRNSYNLHSQGSLESSSTEAGPRPGQACTNILGEDPRCCPERQDFMSFSLTPHLQPRTPSRVGAAGLQDLPATFPGDPVSGQGWTMSRGCAWRLSGVEGIPQRVADGISSLNVAFMGVL